MMRNTLISILLLLVLSVLGFGQVSKDNPLGGSTRTYTEKDGSSETVKIDVKLKSQDDSGLTVSTIHSNIRLTILEVTQKNSNESTTNPVDKPAQKVEFTDENTSKKLISFFVNVSSNTTLNTSSSPFKLPKNWATFSFRITCLVDGIEKTNGILYADRQPDETGVQTLSVKIGEPIWTNNSRNKLFIPITSSSTSIGTKVSLTNNNDDGDEITSKEILLIKKDEPNLVELSGENLARNTNYRIKVEPLVIQGIRFNLLNNPLDCSNGKTLSFCTWRADFKEDFQLNQTTIDKLREKRLITSLENNLPFSITTTDRIKTLKVFLNDSNEIEVNGSGVNERFITLNVVGLPPGKNTLIIKGFSRDDVALSGETKFEFEKKTVPELEGNPKFEFENNSLKLKYKLKGDVIESKPDLSYVGVDNLASGTAGTFPEDCRNKKDCTFTVQVSLDSLTSENKKKSRIPVRLVIKAKERGSVAEAKEIWSADFDILNQAAIKTRLDVIRDTLKNNEVIAKQEIANQIFEGVSVEDSRVDETYDKYIKSNDENKRKKWWNSLIKIGNFALTGYGIPIKIPEL